MRQLNAPNEICSPHFVGTGQYKQINGEVELMGDATGTGPIALVRCLLRSLRCGFYTNTKRGKGHFTGRGESGRTRKEGRGKDREGGLLYAGKLRSAPRKHAVSWAAATSAVNSAQRRDGLCLCLCLRVRGWMGVAGGAPAIPRVDFIFVLVEKWVGWPPLKAGQPQRAGG